MNVEVYSEQGMASVNSFLVDVGGGLLVIDSQRSLGPARRLLARVQEAQQPVLGLVLTHPHPDHLGGLSVLVQAYPDAPLYALAQTSELVQSDEQGYLKLSKQVLGDDFDLNVPLPTHLLLSGQELVVGDTRFIADDAGQGEASCMLMLHAPDADTLFCADVVQHGMTAFLLEGHLTAWQEQLERVAERYAAVQTVYPGHGASGAASELFEFQRGYLETFRRLVWESQEPNRFSPEGKVRIVDAMNQKYPNYLPVAEIPDLLEQNIEAVAKELQVGG